jgi:site-specific DNA recombinase
LITSIQYELESFYYEISKESFEQQTILKRQLTEVKNKIDGLQESFYILKEMDRDTFDKFNARYLEEKSKIEDKLEGSSITSSNMAEYLYEAMSFSSKLSTVWSSGDITLKEDLQKLIYPEGIYYDRKNGVFRTEKKNFIFSLIEAHSESSKENRKGENSLIDRLSPSAEREGFEPSYRQSR